MERLTEKHYLGTAHYMKCSSNCNVDMDCIDCPSFDRLVERLAAYEDTGLTPEQLTAADVEPVVRCKYYDPENRECITCKADGGITDPFGDSFCSLERGGRTMEKQLTKNDVRELFMDVINLDLYPETEQESRENLAFIDGARSMAENVMRKITELGG